MPDHTTVTISYADILPTITARILADGDILCPKCNGLALVTKEWSSGKFLIACRHCLGDGILHKCSYCGKHRTWGEFSGPHECDGIRDARRFEWEKKEHERWEKAEKLTPEQAKERFEQLYVEEADECGLTEDVISDHEDGGYPRMRIYGTWKKGIKLDAKWILENAVSDLHEDVYDAIPSARIKELQTSLDAWVEKVAPLTETYFPDYRYAVVLPEVVEGDDEDGDVS